MNLTQCLHINKDKTNCRLNESSKLHLIDTNSLCIFHSKNKEWKKENGFVKYFLELIETLQTQSFSKRKIKIAEIIFVSDKNIKYLRLLNYIWDKEIEFVDCEFNGGLCIEQVNFEKGITIKGGSIEGLDIKNSNFKEILIIENIKNFNSYCMINKCSFDSSIIIKDVCFNDMFEFTNSKIKSLDYSSITRIENVKFNGPTILESLDFKNQIRMKNIKFFVDSEFKKLLFNNPEHYSDYYHNPICINNVSVLNKSKLTIEGTQIERVFRAITDISFDEIDGLVLFKYADFNYLNDITRKEIIKLEKIGKILIEEGCDKYRHRSDIKRINLQKDEQEIVLELSQTFINYFKNFNGINLGVEILERTCNYIDIYYFSDENISKNEFILRLENTEIEFWQLVGNKFNKPNFSNSEITKFLNTTDTLISIASIFFKICSRVIFGGLRQNDLNEILRITQFNKFPVVKGENLFSVIIENYNQTVLYKITDQTIIGDYVVGDKTMTEINNSQVQGLNIGTNINSSGTTNTQGDFNNKVFVKIFKEEEKNNLLFKIGELQEELRKIKNEIQSFKNISIDDKEEIENKISNNIQQIKNVKSEVELLPVGQESSPDKIKMIESYMDNTTSMVEKVQSMTNKASELSEKLSPYIPTVLALINSIRGYLGL